MPFLWTNLGLDAKVRIKISIFECFMENMHKYIVAGHSFGISLPEGMSAQQLLKPYEPFVVDAAPELLFALRLELVDSLKSVTPAKVLKCLNEESPYFWIFEEEDGEYSFGFSYTKAHPDCVLKVSAVKEGSIIVDIIIWLVKITSSVAVGIILFTVILILSSTVSAVLHRLPYLLL